MRLEDLLDVGNHEGGFGLLATDAKDRAHPDAPTEGAVQIARLLAAHQLERRRPVDLLRVSSEPCG